MQHKVREEYLTRVQRELQEREVVIVERELKIAIQESVQNKAPKPAKRSGKFRRSKLEKRGWISSPKGNLDNVYILLKKFHERLDLGVILQPTHSSH